MKRLASCRLKQPLRGKPCLFVIRPKRLLACMALLLLPCELPAENWPGWRGPRGDGSSLDKNVPTKWSGSQNVAWKVAIPGIGHASPTCQRSG